MIGRHAIVLKSAIIINISTSVLHLTSIPVKGFSSCPISTSFLEHSKTALSSSLYSSQDLNDCSSHGGIEEKKYGGRLSTRRGMLSHAAKNIATITAGVVGSLKVVKTEEASAAFNNRLGGLPNKIRGVCVIMVSS